MRGSRARCPTAPHVPLPHCAGICLAIINRSKSSRRWLAEHFADPFVKRAQAEGMRSRAVYKLEELIERDQLLKPGMWVVDLGAAPGGWSQLVRRELGDHGRVFALDILEMPPIAGVDFVHGDFREAEPLSLLEAALQGRSVDLVLSDMAPNMSGMAAVDQPRSMHLVELACDFADRHLRPGGTLLMKLFQGQGSDLFIKELRQQYAKVQIRKPKASRNRSPEVYALATGKRGRAKEASK
jgi:23S rRNA (uridine2552-2'-O)-methyltransferase